MNTNTDYQNIYVTLEDGTVGMFSGPALTQDTNKIVSVSLSRPTKLPDNLNWEQLWQELKK
jgi:hypothetical protein